MGLAYPVGDRRHLVLALRCQTGAMLTRALRSVVFALLTLIVAVTHPRAVVEAVRRARLT